MQPVLDDDIPVGRVLSRRDALALFGLGDGYAATFSIALAVS